MADTGRPDDPTEDAPSLEMPSFSLRRRKRAAELDEVPEAEPEPAPEPTAVLPPQPPQRPVAEPTEADEREPRRRGELPVSGLPAAAVTGVVVGGLAVLLAWLATTSCEAVRGTSSCGRGPGLLILVAVLVVLAYAGGWLLRLFAVPEPGSTSILAVGIMAVLVMVFLLGSTDEWWMVIALPVVTVLAYVASWWVTTSVRDGDAGADAPEPHDVR
ncbi:hypothetical protein [Nocardioides astragali]|uniref:Uncharacterized protein n=1 Tax=Nocardioides astragali TaxID=1776736 RepID=A0ABW2MZ72_9ACTN|nr:hypothetical protein [Nocardioides astragali]